VERFKEVVAHDIQRRFNVLKNKMLQFCYHTRSSLSPANFVDDKNMKTEVYSIFKEQLALVISEDECQIVKDVAVESPKKGEKTALAILLGEDEIAGY